MCDFGISETAMAVIAVGSAAASTAAAAVAAKQQAVALGRQGQARADQISVAGSAALGIRARQARLDQARAEVSGGEAGIKGNSYEANLSNISQQANMDKGTIEQNTKNNQASNQQDVNATFSRIQQPNYAGAALQIGSTYANSSFNSSAMKINADGLGAGYSGAGT
jgi:endonuclease/exonuclease/phosphatase (EEP) superfamily protein YafD